MRDIASLLEHYRSQGNVITVEKTLSTEYEPTKVLEEAERKGVPVIFNVQGFPMPCVGSLIPSREHLYTLMGVRSDEDAYRRVLAPPPSNDWFIEKPFENIFSEFNGNVKDLPAIKFYEKDGGRYITTSIIVARVPGTNTYNASVHRLMISDEKGFAIRIVPRHLYRIYEDNLKEGKETPVAIMIGASPLTLLASSLSPPLGVFELSLYKNLANERLEIVYTPNYGLPVDASSAIIIEGVLTSKLVDEGPFVDLLNLYDRKRKQPYLRVEKIYLNQSSRAFFHVLLPGGLEHKTIMGFPREAAIWDAVRKAVPRVIKVRLTPAGGGWLHAIISIERNSDGDGKTAIMAAFGAHPSVKHVVVVDYDIDPDKPEDVEWAIATRFRADKGLVIINNARGSTLDPTAEDGIVTKMGIDATYPLKERSKYERPTYPKGR